MPDKIDRLQALAARVAELEAEREGVLRLARTDSLTGLINRGAFTAALADRLGDAARRGGKVALFIIDLDRFKQLNDTLGHQAGDRLLAEVGKRLAASCEGDQVVARLGGDEFALIADAADFGPGDIGRRAERLLAGLAQPIQIEGRSVSPLASIGVAVYPDDAASPADLQRFADMALYRAKTGSGPPWSAFDAELRAQSERRRTLEAELRRAIPLGEIEPWFQPVLDAEERIVGVEVLARWRHPEQGLLAPAAFVPAAEELGLIGAIDEAVFDAACAIAAPWVAEGLIDRVSCNVSPRELLDPGFSRKLIGRLSRTALPATALSVEITETFLIKDLALSRRHIERLCAKGVQIALDDFGLGYSNLRALMHLPIQMVKLDRSLIADVGRDARVSKLVSALLHTARALGVSITAEGVEEAGQAAFLRNAGCEHMQGYLFARPMPAVEMDALLRLKAQAMGPVLEDLSQRVA